MSTCSPPRSTLAFAPSIHTRLSFVHPLYLRSTTSPRFSTPLARTVDRAEHALPPTKMPIEWDPSDQEVPCGLLSLYHSVLSHGGFEAVEAADSWQLVANREEETRKKGLKAMKGVKGVKAARKLDAKEYREAYVRYPLLSIFGRAA